MIPYREDRLLRMYIDGRNAARDGLTKEDMPGGLDGLERVNWECGFIDYLAEQDKQKESCDE